MTEDEAKQALFKINYEYMSHTKEERLKLYDDYKQKREYIKMELTKSKREQIESESKKNIVI